MIKGMVGEVRKALGRSMFRFNAMAAVVVTALYMGSGSMLSGCMGGSDGVENPKMELSFRPDDGSAATAGRVSLYGKNLNPVEDSTPILTKDFSGTASFTPEEIDAALRLVLAHHGKDSSALKDTTVEFNVVATAGDKEAFVGGFKYRRGLTAGFARVLGNTATAFGTFRNTFTLPKAVRNYSGRIGLQGVSLKLDYIYIPGSPYHSVIGTDSAFNLPRISEGTYDLVGVRVDSAEYWKSNDSLSTSDTAYVAKSWDVITFIPGQ